MNKLFISYCFLLLSLQLNAADFKIPADLIVLLFKNESSAQDKIHKRPFDLNELEAIILEYATNDKIAQKITQRYLSISYPKGSVAIKKILGASIPDKAKSSLLKAPVGSLIISLEDLELESAFSTFPQFFLKSLVSADRSVINIGSINIDDILNVNHEYYSGNRYYGAYVYNSDVVGSRYLLSVPNNKHLVDSLFNNHKEHKISIYFTNHKCKQNKCRSKKQGVSYALFSFSDKDVLYIKSQQKIGAKCKYESGYKRDYDNKTEIEFVFNTCELLSINDKPPKRNYLLEDLLHTR